MATFQDCSVGLSVAEAAYKTNTTVTRFYEDTDESLDWNKGTKVGQGLRVGGRVARSARRVVPTAQGAGDISVEATSKGMGLLWNYCLGSNTVTLVSGSTYQHNFTLGDTPPSATIQKGMVEVGGTVDPITFLGCMVASWEFDFLNSDIPMLKTTWDMGDVTTATSYATPSYSSSPNLYHFANATLTTGNLTAPTTTVLGSSITSVADVRGGSITCNNNLRTDRFNVGGGGRKSKPTVGLREITGSLDIEYDSTTFRDALLNDTPMSLIIQYTAGSLSTGSETLQIILPEIKFDSELPKTNGTDLIVQNMQFSAYDNLTAAQPIWVVMRTADTAI